MYLSHEAGYESVAAIGSQLVSWNNIYETNRKIGS